MVWTPWPVAKARIHNTRCRWAKGNHQLTGTAPNPVSLGRQGANGGVAPRGFIRKINRWTVTVDLPIDNMMTFSKARIYSCIHTPMHTTARFAHEPPSSSYHIHTARCAHACQTALHLSLRSTLKTHLRNFVSMLTLPKHISAEPLYLDTAYGYAGSQIQAYIRTWYRQIDSRTPIPQPLQPQRSDSWQTASLFFIPSPTKALLIQNRWLGDGQHRSSDGSRISFRASPTPFFTPLHATRRLSAQGLG